MSEPLAELLCQTIDGLYALPREDRCWKLKENDQHVQICVPNGRSFAFSLDHADAARKPLAFFSGGSPSGVAKMCDAILACRYEGRCYLFLIEMKTSHTGYYKEQLENGRLFCDWLLQLYRHYGHLEETPIFISLLIWFPPRREFNKESVNHRDSSSVNEKAKQKNFDYAFNIQNQSEIRVTEVLKSTRKHTSDASKPIGNHT